MTWFYPEEANMEMIDQIGYIFLCSDATEDECLKRKLLGGGDSYFKHIKSLKIGDLVYLYNYNSKRLHGPFIASSVATKDLVSSAWGGQYPWQITFSSPSKCRPVSRDHLVSVLKFNKKGFPVVKIKSDQIGKLEELFKSEKRHPEYDDSASLVTVDGHKVRSEPERKIDNWLFENRIIHAYEYPIPGKKRCDFYIPGKNSDGIYIEYWGLDNKAYLENKAEKIKIYAENNLKLIELVEKDLKDLDSKLAELLSQN